MHSDIKDIIRSYQNDLLLIFPISIIDIVLYGSVVTGDFTPGKGDIDIIVYLSDAISDIQENAIYELHDRYRNTNSLHKQIEGTFYSLNTESEVFDGIYIGTTRKGWKRISKQIHDCIEQGLILQNHECVLSKIEMNEIFETKWKDIITLIKRTPIEFTQLSERLRDYDFDIYAIQTSARNIHTLLNRNFTTKTDAIDNLQKMEEFKKYKRQLEIIKRIRYPYNKNEFREIERKDLNGILKTMFDLKIYNT